MLAGRGTVVDHRRTDRGRRQSHRAGGCPNSQTATNWFGHEGSILRFVFLHSIALACLVGILVMLQAYVSPFTSMVY